MQRSPSSGLVDSPRAWMGNRGLSGQVGPGWCPLEVQGPWCGGVAISGMSFMADQDASGSWLGNGGGKTGRE